MKLFGFFSWNLGFILMVYISSWALVIGLHYNVVNAEMDNEVEYGEENLYNMSFVPSRIDELIEDEEIIVYFNIICCVETDLQLSVVPEHLTVAVISANSTFKIQSSADGVVNGSFTVLGKRLGKTYILFYLHPVGSDYSEEDLIYADYEVIVLREHLPRDEIYEIGIIICAALIYLGFGCQIDLQWIWKILKKPAAPAISVFCQFIILPLLGLSIVLLLRLDDEYAFGLLGMACSPGGGGSNAYTHILGGDLELSITCTFINTILSLVFMPFWMFSLGRLFINDGNGNIPFTSIIRILLSIILPLVIGLIIRKLFPKIAKFMVKVTKPFSLIFILYILTFGTWVHWYMWEIVAEEPKVIPAAILLPVFGFLLGYGITYLFKQGKRKAKTICIETGYQNASIPIIMLQGNFQQPAGDLGAVMPVATAFFMQIPLYIWFIVIQTQNYCKYEIEDQNMVMDLNNGETKVDITVDVIEAENQPDMINEYEKRTEKRKENHNRNSIATISYTNY